MRSLGPIEEYSDFSAGQALPTARSRLCLLKGCVGRFKPSCPLSRYCSPECRAAGRRWTLHQADQRYRQTEAGKQRRREQSQRYRQQVADRRMTEQGTSEPEDQQLSVGDQVAPSSQKTSGCLCARPGCYERFAPSTRSPGQRFCSSACRNALQRVLRRERFWRHALSRVASNAPRAPDSS